MARALTSAEYELLIENSPVMIWGSGLDGSCDYFNTTWLLFTGRRLEQELGNGWAEGVHPEDADRCLSHYLEHFRRHERFEMEYRLRRHDGVYRWIVDRGIPFSNAGTFAGFIGSCVDIDECRRAHEAQQILSQEQLALAHDLEKWILAGRLHEKRSDGLGPGLFIAKAIARAHGGELEVDSSNGVTRFPLVLARHTCDC